VRIDPRDLQRASSLRRALRRDGPHGARSLKRIKKELELNPLLLEDFPEVCYPIRMLERIVNRSRGQTLDGEPTLMEWTAEGITLPTVKGHKNTGSVIYVASIEAAFRGLNVVTADGEVIRPDIVMIDDAQTRETAKSPAQTALRESIVNDDILGLAGPTTTIAATMLCTVIYPNDLSDRHLSPDKHPEWQGIRTKAMPSMPKNMDWWDHYANARRESIKAGDAGRQATELYIDEQAVADEGAVVSWPERMKDGEVSGIQGCMNFYIDNPRGFKAEWQNDPDAGDVGEGVKTLDAALITARFSGCERYAVPKEATRLVAFVDVGGELLWFCVCAFTESFGGSVVDYGCWPRQARTMFAANDPRPGLSTNHPGLSESERVYAGLEKLVPEILGRTYYRDGTESVVGVDRCLIDCGWQGATVFQWVRQSSFRDIIFPSKGVGRSKTQVGVARWRPRPGERVGYHWRLTVSQGALGVGRMVQFDPDAWKTVTHELFTAPLGGPRTLTMFGLKGMRTNPHDLFGEHCQAETAEPVTMHGDSFDSWSVKPDKPDNHLFDCLVGCHIAASVAGVQWSGAVSGKVMPAKPKRIINVEELYAAQAVGAAT
jgi:hypothetical protein